MQNTTKVIFLYEDELTLKSIRYHYLDHSVILNELNSSINLKIEYGTRMKSKKYDGIYIPPSTTGLPLDKVFSRQVSSLIRNQPNIKLMASCGGVVRLAKTGIINDKKVTSHWRYEDELNSLNNNLTLNLERKLIIDKNLVTSGGVMSYLSLFNWLINELFGENVAKNYKRFIVSPTDNPIQTNVIRYKHKYPIIYNDIFKKLEKLKSLTLVDLSEQIGLSQRQTQRYLVKTYEASFSKILVDYRLSKSTEMLLNGKAVKLCSYKMGFEDPMSFRRFFKKNTNMSISTFLLIYL